MPLFVKSMPMDEERIQLALKTAAEAPCKLKLSMKVCAFVRVSVSMGPGMCALRNQHGIGVCTKM